MEVPIAHARWSLDDLAWMAGEWTGVTDQVQMEEVWLAPRGGMLLGLHRDVIPGKPAFFEYLRIVETGEDIVYEASPGGRTPTPFTLTSIDGERAIFENSAHDFPQRIIYSRRDDSLKARIEGTRDGRSRSEEWSWQLRNHGEPGRSRG